MNPTGVPGSGAGESDPAPPSDTPTYQGSHFPWWLALLYLAFAAFGFVYMLRYYLPDLKAWLVR